MDRNIKTSTSFKRIDALKKDEATEEVRTLREEINYHDYLYYVKNAPAISDAAYDKLFQRLEQLETAFPELKTPDSPTVRIGGETVSQLKKVKHQSALLSLQAMLNEGDVKSFLDTVRSKAGKDTIRYCLEPKFDGLSVEVVFENGQFKYGATRGDGMVGEDISHNLKTIRALPLKLRQKNATPKSLSVRGEVFIPKKGFIALNKQRVELGEQAFANPRNAAAGLMRQYESHQIAEQALDIFFYDILALDTDLPATHEQVLQKLSEWGLKTSPLNETVSSHQQIKNYHHSLEQQRDELDYEIDGIVIKVNDNALREKLGTRERNPRWALAWKFKPREEITSVEDIVVNVGRTGILTPVALLQPVDVGGITVSRATLHNEAEVHRKDIRVGDNVRIIRAGDVIPEVAERVKSADKKRGKVFKMPPHCPACGAPVIHEGAYYLCSAGLSCPAQLAGHIQHFADREAMNIDHLGEKTAEQLVKKNLVRDLSDLYKLQVDDIASLEGFATRSAQQLYESIQHAKNPRLDRFLYALGIQHVGQRMARELAEAFHSLDALAKADKQSIEKISGIGAEIAESTANFFADPTNRSVLKRMRERGLKISPIQPHGKQPLKDKTFVFTGTLEAFTREEAKEKVQALGGKSSSNVSSETDYVVVGKNPGSKLEKAKDSKIKRISEKEFIEMLK